MMLRVTCTTGIVKKHILFLDALLLLFSLGNNFNIFNNLTINFLSKTRADEGFGVWYYMLWDNLFLTQFVVLWLLIVGFNSYRELLYLWKIGPFAYVCFYDTLTTVTSDVTRDLFYSMQFETNKLLSNTFNKCHPFLFYASSVVYFVFLSKSVTKKKCTSASFVHWIREFTNNKFEFWIVIGSYFMLLSGAWWAFLESTWGGWWEWDISEILGAVLLFGYVLVLHKRYTNFWFATKTELRLVLVYVWLVVYGIVQLNFAVTAHNFNNFYFYFFNTNVRLELTIMICLLLAWRFLVRQRLSAFHNALLWRLREHVMRDYHFNSALVVIIIVAAQLTFSFGQFFNEFFENFAKLNEIRGCWVRSVFVAIAVLVFFLNNSIKQFALITVTAVAACLNLFLKEFYAGLIVGLSRHRTWVTLSHAIIIIFALLTVNENIFRFSYVNVAPTLVNFYDFLHEQGSLIADTLTKANRFSDFYNLSIENVVSGADQNQTVYDVFNDVTWGSSRAGMFNEGFWFFTLNNETSQLFCWTMLLGFLFKKRFAIKQSQIRYCVKRVIF